jgi:uncharacterized protein (TIGR03437 family)
MKHIWNLSLLTLLVFSPVTAQTLSGTLSNFDVFNDTGEKSHGFEIEIDGLSSKDISFTFGGTYIRYGDPVKVDFPGGVVVRYASPYDQASHSFTTGTPVPPAPPTATAGHSCWTGGLAGYPNSGCEHFGVGLAGNPTAVAYRWLIEDPAAPGTLKPYSSNVAIAAPLWTVSPPPVAGGAVVVDAQVEPPKPEHGLVGDAVWVKVFVTESPQNAELNHLLTDDKLVPQDASQSEVEWELLQADPAKPEGGRLHHGKSLGAGSQSVIRRFEFYKYTGLYSAEHEALCGGAKSGGGGGKGGSGGGGGCSAPAAGELGAYIGAQMAAAQFGAVAAPKVAITSVVDNATNQAGTASGSWVTIYGSNLSGTTRQWQASDFQGSNLPLALDGVKVTINGKAAAIWYISPTQLNVQAPEDAATGTVPVQVTNSSGSATGTATLQRYAPGFFTFSGKYAVAVHSDGVVAAPVGFFGGAGPSRPAQPGEILAIYGSGFGPSAPAVTAGQMFSGAAALADMSQLHIRIGGVPATVQFGGIVAPGEYQFNVVVPALPDGDQPLTADMGGVAAQSGVLIPVKN